MTDCCGRWFCGEECSLASCVCCDVQLCAQWPCPPGGLFAREWEVTAKALSAGETPCDQPPRWPRSPHWPVCLQFLKSSLCNLISELRHSCCVREGHIYLMISKETRNIFKRSSCAVFYKDGLIDLAFSSSELRVKYVREIVTDPSGIKVVSGMLTAKTRN